MTIYWLQHKLSCIAVGPMEMQGSAAVLTVGTGLVLPPPQPDTQQVLSSTFEARGVCLGPDQQKELKALTTEWDAHRGRLLVDKD